MSRALVFGGTGALGSAVAVKLTAAGWDVDIAARTAGDGVTLDLSNDAWAMTISAPFDAIVWAQGANMTAGLRDTTSDQYAEIYEANVTFIADSLRLLVESHNLARPARGVVISSIWQITARANKLAYVASKAALAGLVPAIAADLAPEQFAINSVLPGVIDTPMTRANLSVEQLAHVRSETPGGVLATPDDVANAVVWLLDPSASGINGQWIAVDNGWSVIRSV